MDNAKLKELLRDIDAEKLKGKNITDSYTAEDVKLLNEIKALLQQLLENIAKV